MMDADPVWLSSQLWSMFALILSGDLMLKFNNSQELNGADV